ncbi:MAG: ABC transporter ATP-binding protein, partial [Planctomycetes bacterium]|nr:ABC transporter ATP-binding protein [Planctomycetota bacterium]
RWALRDVSFSVERGDVFGFLGPNGAGKTTTIRILLGLVRPTGGTVTVFGERGRRASIAARTRIGALIEIPRFYPWLSGRGNLEVLARLAGGPERDRIEAVLDEVGLASAAEDAVSTYSQGMRQRLGIAQALLGEPELVILDEPTNGLDPHGVRDMKQLIADRNRLRGTTFILSSHQLPEVERMANRVAILRRGELIASGPVAELLGREHATLLVRVSDRARASAALRDSFTVSEQPGASDLAVHAGAGEAPRVAEALVAAGAGLLELHVRKPTLEDYFLRVTEGEGADLGR